MKRALIIIALGIFVLLSAQAATRRALVIGIGGYPAESGWKTINGDKDIPLVEDILFTNGFDKQNIIELKNEQATCAAIKSEFEKLIGKAQTGDYIYIHFSGHGQQITDLNGDESDGLDEAWIPYDAQIAFTKGKYEGENHLVDDLLNQYLHRLREKIGKDGKIVVVADACHSGSGWRKETEVIRGTAAHFVIPDAAAKSLTTAALPSYGIEWTFISACQSKECNYEYNGNGSLTYALHRQRTNFSTYSTEAIRQNIVACMKEIVNFGQQEPVVEFSPGTETDIFL